MQIAMQQVNMGVISWSDFWKWYYEARELAKEAARRGVLWSGFHGCQGEDSDEDGKEFSKLLPYTEALKRYPCIEMGIDVFIPIDIEERIQEFLGFRPSKKFYLVNQEYLEKRGYLKRWREEKQKQKTLDDYVRKRESDG
jgi:uncharacterized SAM-binding protein YcdF (DUF218 family)